MKTPNPFPAAIRKIGIPAPASAPAKGDLAKGLKMLEIWGIEAVVGKNVAKNDDVSYLSAGDEARLADFNGFVRDETIDLILCARGGYGSMRILRQIDWGTLQRRKLPVLGYSDITAIHLGILAKGAGVPIVCNMACGLAKTMANPFSAESMTQVLQGIQPEGVKLQTVKDGEASGPLVPVNLTLLTSLLGSEFMPSLKGALLAVEDIGEKARAIDRMLAQLEISGILGELSGLIFCNFSECEGADSLNSIFHRYAKSVNGPVMTGLPFGHLHPTLSFRMGERASLRNATLECSGRTAILA